MIGFIILSHKDPHQLARLTRTLAREYQDPPITVHHDTSQCPLDRTMFPPCVMFVDPPIRTGWGKWSLVEATLAALRLLYAKADPQWFMLLSSADYPIKSAEKVIDELNASTVDAYIDHRPVPKHGAPVPTPNEAPWLAQHGSEANIDLARRRYRRAILKYPVIRRRAPRYSTTIEHGWRLGRETVALPFEPPTSPFRGRFECYIGSQWFTANRRVAHLALTGGEANSRLRRHLAYRVIPDECFFQSLICNQEDLRVDPNPKRYADWDDAGAHPNDLTRTTVAAALASDAHFARKFAPDDPVLDYLDDLIRR